MKNKGFLGKIKVFLRFFRDFLLFLLPIVIFFSYYPVIKLGQSETMNFELSLPLIWLFLFAVFSLPDFFRIVVFGFFKGGKDKKQSRDCREKNNRDKVGVFRGWKKEGRDGVFLGVVVVSLLPLWATISLFWTANFTRGWLTAGILWCLVIAGVGILELLKKWGFKKKYGLILVFLGMSLVICVFCFGQAILDVLGVSRETTLACSGCSYRSFGFPHPSGFAIEPQFMGNLLLAPIFITVYILWKTQEETGVSLSKKDREVEFSKTTERRPKLLRTVTKAQRRGFWLMLFIFIATLFLTFSRGAIYAFFGGLLVFIVILATKRRFPIGTIIITILAFFFTLTTQGVFAEVSMTNDTFSSGVTKAIHHLSLGVIDLRGVEMSAEVKDGKVGIAVGEANSGVVFSGKEGADEDGQPVEKPVEKSEENVGGNGKEEAYFDGYVAESTNVRTKLNGLALGVFSSSLKNTWVGVGIGGAGTAIYQQFPSEISSAKEIVQNQYVSVLLELGIIGVILGGVAVIFIFKKGLGMEFRLVIIPLLVAYGISLMFFAGLPNALHIYLLPVVIFGGVSSREHTD